MSVRESFRETFGEDQATAIENAAQEHENGVHDNRGSDPFKWAISICLGYECASKDSYREHHGITAPWEDISAWIKKHGELSTHDGDIDYLSAFAGVYDKYCE